MIRVGIGRVMVVMSLLAGAAPFCRLARLRWCSSLAGARLLPSGCVGMQMAMPMRVGMAVIVAVDGVMADGRHPRSDLLAGAGAFRLAELAALHEPFDVVVLASDAIAKLEAADVG